MSASGLPSGSEVNETKKAQESVLVARSIEWRPSHCPNQLERATGSPTLIYAILPTEDTSKKRCSCRI